MATMDRIIPVSIALAPTTINMGQEDNIIANIINTK
jgi:hypothetical protein